MAGAEGQCSNPGGRAAQGNRAGNESDVAVSALPLPGEGQPAAKHPTGHHARGTEPTSSTSLLDASEAHGVVLGKLSGESLAAVACCSRQLRDLVEESASGGERWRALAEAELGPSSAALHARKHAQDRNQHRPDSMQTAAEQCSGSRTSGAESLTPQRVETRFWRKLYRCLFTGDNLHWDQSAAAQLWAQVRTPSGDASDAQAPAYQIQPAPSRSPLSQLLARSGHTATMLDDLGLLVIIGGLMNDDDATPETTVLIIRLPSLVIVAPKVTGPHGAPPSRYRHAAVALPASMQESCLKYFRGETLDDGGALLAVHGGYDSDSIYGGSELLLLWVSRDGSTIRWAAVTTSGSPPPPCFHHTLVALRRSPRLVMVGGECSHEQANQLPQNVDTAVMPSNVVFTLWLPSMVWDMQQTTYDLSCGFNPGQRWLHACTLRPKDDSCDCKHEELVVVGGLTPEGVDEMVPYVLHLGTYTWRRPPYSHVFKHNRPAGRHRFATAVTGRFLLVNGGCDRGQWLQDTAILDLRHLTWRPSPKIHSEPLRHQAIAGHTMAGLIAFGGCERGFFGISPVAKMDVLMFGEPPDGRMRVSVGQPSLPTQFAQSMQDTAGTSAAVMQVVPAGPGQPVQSATFQPASAAQQVPTPVSSMYDALFNAFAAGGAAYVMIGSNESNTSSGEGSFDASEWVDGESDMSDAGNGGVPHQDGGSGASNGKGSGPSGSGGSGSGGSGSGEATDTLQLDSGSCDGRGSCAELPNTSDSSDQNQ